MQIWCNLRFC